MSKFIKNLAFAAAIILTGANPMTAQSVNEPLILINPFVVPAGSEDDAIAMWMQARDFLQTQPGLYFDKTASLTFTGRHVRPD